MRRKLLFRSGYEIMDASSRKEARVAWFSWGKSRKQSPKRAPRRLPRRELAPVEEIVEQGLLVADVAVRMTVKNAIIMNALKDHADYDEVEIIGLVADALNELAVERERDARHIERVRSEIRSSGQSSWRETEYGNGDSRTLKHRQEVYERVAQELRALTEDQEYLKTTAERSRVLAWEEIGDSLKERASHPYYSGGRDDDYRDNRDERIQQLISMDLTSLIKQNAPKSALKKGLIRLKASKSD